MRFNGTLLGDLCGSKEGPPFHIFMTLARDGDKLHVRFLGTEWLADQIRAMGWPRFEPIDEDDGGGILLTASTKDMRRDLLVYFCDERALDEAITLERTEAADPEQKQETPR